MSIKLPPLPIGEDCYEVMSWGDIRARDLEVAKCVLEAAAQAAGPDDSYQDCGCFSGGKTMSDGIQCTCPAKDMPFGRCCKSPTSASVIAGLEMALSQASAMIERQQHVMQRAIDAWDSTTHQKNGDGRLWQCMEELRGECAP